MNRNCKVLLGVADLRRDTSTHIVYIYSMVYNINEFKTLFADGEIIISQKIFYNVFRIMSAGVKITFLPSSAPS